MSEFLTGWAIFWLKKWRSDSFSDFLFYGCYHCHHIEDWEMAVQMATINHPYGFIGFFMWVQNTGTMVQVITSKSSYPGSDLEYLHRWFTIVTILKWPLNLLQYELWSGHIPRILVHPVTSLCKLVPFIIYPAIPTFSLNELSEVTMNVWYSNTCATDFHHQTSRHLAMPMWHTWYCH